MTGLIRELWNYFKNLDDYGGQSELRDIKARLERIEFLLRTKKRVEKIK